MCVDQQLTSSSVKQDLPTIGRSYTPGRRGNAYCLILMAKTSQTPGSPSRRMTAESHWLDDRPHKRSALTDQPRDLSSVLEFLRASLRVLCRVTTPYLWLMLTSEQTPQTCSWAGLSRRVWPETLVSSARGASSGRLPVAVMSFVGPTNGQLGNHWLIRCVKLWIEVWASRLPAHFKESCRTSVLELPAVPSSE